MKKDLFKNKHLRRLIYAAAFLALAQILPFITGQIPEIGKMLCPMHLPVLLCGFVCGMPCGAAVGFAAPLLRSLLFGVPAMSTAVGMAAELLALGLLGGLFAYLFPKKLPFLYLSLLCAIFGGRLALSLAKFIINGISHTSFSFFAYLTGNILNALPGILLQILLVPPLVLFLERMLPIEKRYSDKTSRRV